MIKKKTEQVIDAALEHKGPVYIRNSAIDVDDLYSVDDYFEIGKATQLRDGNDATIITTGTMMNEGAKAVDRLKKDYGINVRLLQMASIKPIDVIALKKAANETSLIITVEEHNIIGGLGSAVSEIISELGNTKVRRLGINDHFCDIVGSPAYLLNKLNLTTKNIIETTIGNMKGDMISK